MRLIEKENQFWLIEIPNLGQLLKQFGEQPQQEDRIKARSAHQFCGTQNIDDTAPIATGAQKILDVEFRLAEKKRDAPSFSRATGAGSLLSLPETHFHSSC